MKKIFFALVTILGLSANAQIKMPAASPSQTISQEFGLGKIEITYARPSLKGRAVFGNGSLLAPVGEVWRTGANSATKITFSDAVTIGGKEVAAGTYALFTIPGEKEWTIIINTNVKSWGSSDYKTVDDIVRVNVVPQTTNNSTETFTIGVDNITATSATISLKWGTILVNVPFTTDIKPTIRKQIEEATKGTNVSSNVYQTAANFFYDIDKDYDKALVYVDKAIAGNAKAYWLYLLKAKVQKELGDKKGAKVSAETCATIAAAEKNADYVRSANDLLKAL
ncbi:MAG: hypothetical protein RL064_1258 [Bacteroidota bacterium]